MNNPPAGHSPTPQPSSDAERLRIGLADDFEILEELGRGGMAIVFRARDKAMGREVAIKVLPAHLMKDSALVDRFEHEARTAGNLEHPHIIPIYRVGRAGAKRDVSYFVMKLLRGGSLSALLRKRGKLPPDELRTLLMETASALGHATKHAVVHRDVKPDNILFDGEGRSILTDFGIAKTPAGQHSAAGTLVGSPRYMSPEHALSQSIDGRSDLYSLGVVAWEALAGKPPFDADDPLEIIYKHIHEPLPAPPLRTPEERQLYHVIARMLAKKPGDRFQSAHDVIVALGGQILPHTPTGDAGATAPVFTLSPAATEPVATIPPGDAAPAATREKRSRRTLHPAFAWTSIAVLLVVFFGPRTVGLLGPRATPDLVAPPIPKIDTPTPAPAQAIDIAPARTPVSSPATPPTASPSGSPSVVAATPPKPKPRPKPSARAAAILAYNRLKSSCARRDTMPDAKPIGYAVLVDSLADRPRGNEMTLVYDVCGLPSGSPFTVTFTLTKLRQRGFGQQKPHVETTSGKTAGPRSRQRRTLDMREMSAGSYRLDVVVTDANASTTSVNREFRITDM
jgi:eukaryotic-like serine/threonine-protein kinase